MLSSLQLKHAVFNELHLTAHPDPKPEAQIDLAPSITAGHHLEDAYSWRVELGIKFGSQPEDGLNYSGSFTVVGFFQLNPSIPAPEVEALATINGSSLLYGIIREMVSNLTARSANGPLLLPTLDFRMVLSRKEDPVSEGE